MPPGKRFTYEEFCSICSEKGVTPYWKIEKWDSLYKNRTDTKPEVLCTLCNKPHSVSLRTFTTGKEHGLKCRECINKSSGEKHKKRQSGSNALVNVQMEHDAYILIKNSIDEQFDCEKLFDKCKADCVIRLKTESDDSWMGIQIKTTSTVHKGGYYAFKLNGNQYTDMLLACICIDDKSMWLIPYNEIGNVTGINITTSVSPTYDKYKVSNINQKLTEYFNSMKKFSYDVLNTPIDEGTRKEFEFKKIRENTLSDTFTFTNPDTEGESTDFKIGTKTFQEKVGSINTNTNLVAFDLKHNKKSYKVGDNDFYWFHFRYEQSLLCYVIPEKELLSKKTGNIITTLTIGPDREKSLEKYKFNYGSIDYDRLKSIIN